MCVLNGKVPKHTLIRTYIRGDYTYKQINKQTEEFIVKRFKYFVVVVFSFLFGVVVFVVKEKQRN